MPTKTKKVEANEAFVVVLGGREPQYRTEIVRDRHTGQLAEVPLTEYPPLDPGQTGVSYAFKLGQQVRADHPAALAKPKYFDPVDD